MTDEQPVVDSGLACLVMLARFHNVAASAEQLTHEYAEDGRLFGRAEMLLAAKKLSLKAKPARSSLSRLSFTPLPAIAKDSDGSFFIIARMDGDKALIHDPGHSALKRGALTNGDAPDRRADLDSLRGFASRRLARFDFS